MSRHTIYRCTIVAVLVIFSESASIHKNLPDADVKTLSDRHNRYVLEKLMPKLTTFEPSSQPDFKECLESLKNPESETSDPDYEHCQVVLDTFLAFRQDQKLSPKLSRRVCKARVGGGDGSGTARRYPGRYRLFCEKIRNRTETTFFEVFKLNQTLLSYI